MRILSITFLVLITILQVSGQLVDCFNETGIGMFEGANPTSDWMVRAETGSGSLGLETAEVYAGDNAMKATVESGAANWHVRLISVGCEFPLVEGDYYSIAFYLKASQDGEMDIALRDGGTTIETKDLSVESSSDWARYEVRIASDASSSAGRIYISFSTEGTYVIDNITVTRTDCSGEIGGGALVDECDVCAGGNTGIVPGSYCNLTPILPNDPLLTYEGTLYKEISAKEAVLHRFSGEYLNDGPSNWLWNLENAKTQSGISIVFKTNSPVMNFTFSELVDSEQRSDHFAVFKNGELYQDNIRSDEFTLTNFEEDLAEWKITLPSFDGMVFNGLELVDGYTLHSMPASNKPKYFAIGNSITHGVGQDNAGHLTYPFLIADSLGYELHNLGIGGSKISDQIMTNLVGQTADVITVLWGYNDVNANADLSSSGGAYDRYELLLDSLCSSQPQADIYAILPTPTNTVVGGNNASNTIADLRAEEESIIIAQQATCPNLHLVESHDYVAQTGHLNDDVHLNVLGAEHLAHGVITEILDNDLITGVKTYDKLVSDLYPNPTTGLVKLGEVQDYIVYDLLGTPVLIGSSSQIDMSALPVGSYVIKSNGKVERIVKQ